MTVGIQSLAQPGPGPHAGAPLDAAPSSASLGGALSAFPSAQLSLLAPAAQMDLVAAVPNKGHTGGQSASIAHQPVSQCPNDEELLAQSIPVRPIHQAVHEPAPAEAVQPTHAGAAVEAEDAAREPPAAAAAALQEASAIAHQAGGTAIGQLLPVGPRDGSAPIFEASLGNPSQTKIVRR